MRRKIGDKFIVNGIPLVVVKFNIGMENEHPILNNSKRSIVDRCRRCYLSITGSCPDYLFCHNYGYNLLAVPINIQKEDI